MRPIQALQIALASLILIAGCGGGGDDSPPASAGPTAEGFYGGTLTGGTSSAFRLIVLENGEYWSLYGAQASTAFYVAGFVQGTGASNNGIFSSSNAKDFGFSPSVAGSVNATYNATAHTIAGSVSATAGTVTFDGGPIAGSTYNYNTAATVSAVSGAWTLTDLSGASLSLNIASNGAFVANTTAGCNFSGTVTPRASGKNVFNVALTFGASPCGLPGQAATGIAVAYPLTAGGTELVVGVVEGTRNYGTVAFGTR